MILTLENIKSELLRQAQREYPGHTLKWDNGRNIYGPISRTRLRKGVATVVTIYSYTKEDTEYIDIRQIAF